MLKNTYIFQALTHILQSNTASLDTAAEGCYTCIEQVILHCLKAYLH